MINDDIKNLIKDHFKTKTEMAVFLGVTRQAVTNWMKPDKNMSVPHAIKLSKKLNCCWTDIREDLK